MKTIITILLFSITATAQNKDQYAFISFGVDGRHLVHGSEQTGNNPTLNYTAQIGANYRNFEVALELEQHTALDPDYLRYGVASGYEFHATKKMSFYNGLNFSIINRESNSAFFSWGYRAETRYDIGRFMAFARMTIQQRPDVEDKDYVPSGEIGLTFKLN